MKKIKKSDFILIGSLLAICVILFLVMQFTKTDGGYAVVVVNGKEIANYPLNKDIDVPLTNGEDYNVLVIESGEAKIESASCPDKLCVKQRPIHYNGETLVCLPNKITVKIVSKINPETDFIS